MKFYRLKKESLNLGSIQNNNKDEDEEEGSQCDSL
jgi:hypothetical protein